MQNAKFRMYLLNQFHTEINVQNARILKSAQR